MDTEKFNTIMPQTTDRVLCIEIDRPISEIGYLENLLPRLDKMIENHGEIRILLYYKKFKGWEENAAMLDLESSAKYSQKLKKMALVAAPEKEVFHRNLKKELFGGDIQLFKKDELSEAIEWVSN